ncbi:DotA/TraY family protein [Thiovibrio sp. JS02]
MSISDWLAAAAGDPGQEMLNLLSGEGPLSDVLYVFNIAVFSLGVVVLIYSAVKGFVGTAVDGGEKLRKAETAWTPIRIMLGIAGLTPVWHGLTFSQVIVIFCSIVGIGVGGVAWQGAWEGLLSWNSTSFFSAPVAAPQDEGAQALFSALVCQEAVNKKIDQDRAELGVPTVEGRVEGRQWPGEIEMPWEEFRGRALIFGGVQGYPLAVCGGVRLPEPQGEDSQYFSRDAILTSHLIAMQYMARQLHPLARALVYQQRRPDPAALAAAKDNYRQAVSSSLADVALQAGSAFDRWMAQDRGKSWIYAGATLAKIASINREIQAVAGMKLEAVPPFAFVSDSGQAGPAGLTVLANVQESQIMAEAATAPEKTYFSLKKPDMGVLFSPLAKNLSTVLSWVEGGEQDLLGGLGSLGHKLIIGTLAAVTAVVAALATASAFSGGMLGGMAGSILSIFVFLFCLPLLSTGLIFAYYLPFLPLIYWVLGVLAWLIVFVEALFGAPLWAFAHLDSDAGAGLGPRTSHGYIFLMHLLFRPTLMLGGLVAGWLIIQFFGEFLRLAIKFFFEGAFQGLAGLLGFIACMIIFSILVWQICGRAFSFIHHLPSEVIAWAGGYSSKVGGEGGEREVENKTTGVVANIQRAGGGRMGPPGDGGKNNKKNTINPGGD